MSRRVVRFALAMVVAASVLGVPESPVAVQAHDRHRGVQTRADGGADHRPGGARAGRRIAPRSEVGGSQIAGSAFPGPSTSVPPGQLPPDGVTATAEPAPVPGSPTVTATPPAAESSVYAGLQYSPGDLTMMDSIVAVGPEHVAQVTDQTVRILSRTGAEVFASHEWFFFDLPDPDSYDAFLKEARLLYDSVHGRWVATLVSYDCYASDESAIGTGYLDIMVSDGADPTGDWTIWSIAYPDAFPDSISVGTSSDKVLVTADVVEILGSPGACAYDLTMSLGSEIAVMAWSELAAGGDATIDLLGDPTDYPQQIWTWRAAVQTPATSPTAYLVGMGINGPDYHVMFATVTGSPAAGTTAISPLADLSAAGVLAPLAIPPGPRQPDTDQAIPGVSDPRIRQAIWQDGRLAFVSTYPCDPPGGAVEERDCVRVSEMVTSGATPTRRQDFLMSESGADLFAGGIGYATSADLHVTWDRTSEAPDGYPSLYAAYQQAAAPGTISQPDLLKAGTARYDGPGWGRVTPVVPDPQVIGAVWQAGQFGATASAWDTRISQLQSGGATYVPISPLRVMDSRTPLGVGGSFAANAPRTFQVAGFSSPSGSIPATAIAVTGNLTVTGQTGAGYVSLTTIATTSPRSSTLNFPAGDTRANNVTIPLSAAGKLAAVYKAAAGRSAQLVFDVTGYFVPGASGSGYSVLAPTRFLDSRAGKGIGLTGRFVHGVPRKLDVAGVKGVPPDAVAVTANLTVVNQTRAGFVSVTPTAVASPATSTINFPTGDTRANGLTVKLGGGDLYLVYRGSGGQTDLVLDITGYYRPAGAGLAFYPLDPGRLMDTRTTVLTGLTGTFSSGTPRRLDTDGHWGVPAGAKAITGNLTVTAQTGAGYVSGTPTAVANPTTSTLNFPTGDTRANGITVPLNSNGNQYFVYKSSSGRTTHLILDLTGYFK